MTLKHNYSSGFLRPLYVHDAIVIIIIVTNNQESGTWCWMDNNKQSNLGNLATQFIQLETQQVINQI